MTVSNEKTLTCRDIVRSFGDYVENDIDPILKERMRSHIALCPACQEFERTYCLTIELASELRPSEAAIPIGVKNRLRAALNERLGLSLPLPGDA